MKLPSKIKYLLGCVVLTIVYFAAGKLGLMLASVHPSASSVWAPTGIALAAFICLGYRYWPAVLSGAFAVNLVTAGSIGTSLGIGVGNTLEGLVGAYLVNRFARGPKVFEQPQDILKFVLLAAFLSTMISPTVGIISLSAGGFASWGSFGKIWLTWWLGDAAGALIVTPVLVLWNQAGEVRWNRQKVLEVTFLAVSLCVMSLLAFSKSISLTTSRLPLEFLCIPPVIWTAYRFGGRETATATFILSMVSILGTLLGYGPFARSGPPQSLLLLQTYMAVVAVMGLILSALVSERDRSEEALQQANDILELRVAERTISLSQTVADLQLEVRSRIEIEKSLRESEDRFRLLVETIKDYAIFMLDPQGNVISWNAGAERIMGYPAEEIIGRHFSLFYTQSDIERKWPYQLLEFAKSKGHVSDIGVRLRKGGTFFWGDVEITAIFDKEGTLRGFAKITRDLTERLKAEEALHESEERFRQLVDSNIIGFMLTDKQGRILEANEALLKMVGYSREELANPGFDMEVITPETYRTIDQWMQERLATIGVCPPIEKEFIRKDGAHVPVLVGMMQLRGKEQQRFCFIIDGTERRLAQDALRKAYDELELRVQQRTAELQEEIFRRQRAEEELRNQAIRDPLTGLYNRRGFLTLAEKHLDLAKRQKMPLVIFMCDLDDLKPINDTFGHAEGDFALTQLAVLLRKTFRQADIVARIGGDEFAVACVEETHNTVEDFTDRLQKQINDYNRYSGRPYRLQLSFGTARIDPDGTRTLEQGMLESDAMLYERKKHKGAGSSKTLPRK